MRFYEIHVCYIIDYTFLQSQFFLNRCLLVAIQPLTITKTIATTDIFLLSILYVFILCINYDFASCYNNKKATCTNFIQHDFKWMHHGMISNGYHSE